MNGFKILEWLFLNGNAYHNAERWAALFNIEIIDADGWRGLDFNEEIDLRTFVNRVARSTINPNKVSETK